MPSTLRHFITRWSAGARTRGAFAIGSERKVGGVDVHLCFEVVLPIKRGGRGLYKIVTHKDRLGRLGLLPTHLRDT